MLTPEALYERLHYDPDTDYFPAAFNEAERLLDSERVMTYADLLYRPLQVLEADSALRGRVEGFLDHVIIDEYQDINAAQQRLLAVLAGSRASVMAVGDANQCIYEWRGARPDTMLENFTATFGQATDYPFQLHFVMVMPWRWRPTMRLLPIKDDPISYVWRRRKTPIPAWQWGRAVVSCWMR